MNAKKAKRIRQRLRASGYDEADSRSVGGEPFGAARSTVTNRHLVPDCGRSLYRRIKQLGID